MIAAPAGSTRRLRCSVLCPLLPRHPPPPCRPATAPQVTALQIAALKRLGKGNKILLLDRSGGAAKAVARALAERGFGRVFVIKGGFQVGCLDGRHVWGYVWQACFGRLV